MQSVDLRCTVEDGRLKVRNRHLLSAVLRRWEGKDIDVSISLHKDSRSQKQNRWYWGQIIHLVSEHTGHTPDELHEYFKARFIPQRVALHDDNGEVIDDRVIGGSSAKLDVEAFAHYCECIRQFAAEELGVVIPDPDGGY